MKGIFLFCLFYSLFVSLLTFPISSGKKSLYLACIFCHIHFTNDDHSNNNKVNINVSLSFTLTFMLKIACFEFVAATGIAFL